MNTFMDEEKAFTATLDETPLNIEDFSGMCELYNMGIAAVKAKLEMFDSLSESTSNHDVIKSIEYRLKSEQSISRKLKKKNLPPNRENIYKHVTDFAGIRVVCSYIDDIYSIYDALLNDETGITLLRTKNYIDKPKDSGYRSLHLILDVPVYTSDHPDSVPVEVQIRTIAMDFWASLEHQLKYKSDKKISDELMSELFLCADSISDLDHRMQSIHRRINENPK